MGESSLNNVSKQLLIAVLLTLIYIAAGKVGLSLALINPSASAVWPPTGIAIAGLLILGYRMWPAILIGAFIVNISTSGSLPASVLIATGNTLEALIAAFLVNRFAHGRMAFENAYDVAKFSLFAGLFATAVGATIGTIALASSGLATADAYSSIWLTWWLGDAAGAFLVTPILIVWSNPDSSKAPRQRIEASIMLALLAAAGISIALNVVPLTVQRYPIGFLALPIVVWCAFRYGQRYVALAAFILCAIAIWRTARDIGPLSHYPPNESLILLQLFLGIVSLNGLVIAAVVGERKRAQESQRLLATIVESSNDAIVGKTLDGIILSWNKGAENIYGYSAQEAIGRSISFLAPANRVDEIPQILQRLRNGERIEHYETLRVHKDGTPLTLSLTISPIKDERGRIIGASSTARDIAYRRLAEEAENKSRAELEHRVQARTEELSHTIETLNFEVSERRQAEERVRFMALHDTLTGLPNRLLFRDRAGQAIAHSRRNQQRAAILFLDLDDFKHVNDSLGHLVGDKLLRATADRLRGRLRENDSIARLGGDEFIIAVPGLNVDHDAMVIAEKILETLRRPLLIDNQEFHVSASIGISLYPSDGDNVETLMRAADAAMYHAKEKGRNNYQFFTPAMNDEAQRRLEIASRLHQALSRDEFMLHYQPQLDMTDGRIIATEALMRWRSPDIGMVPPNVFIKIAEQTGLIVALGEWVLHRACAQLKDWRAAGHKDLRMSVNVSPHQFRRPGFTDLVTRILNEHELPPQVLELEITEGILTMQNTQNLETLEQLERLGVQLAVDDFGTGYSSLAYLQRFPVHTLKIDQSFVNGIGSNQNDATIVSTIIAMAHALHLNVVAEGVETAEQAEFLKAHGCHVAQGYYFSRPVPADQFEQLLAAPVRVAPAD